MEKIKHSASAVCIEEEEEEDEHEKWYRNHKIQQDSPVLGNKVSIKFAHSWWFFGGEFHPLTPVLHTPSKI